MGFNPYQGGTWQPNTQQYYNPYAPYNQQAQQPYTYSGTGSHLYRRGRSNVIRVSGPESAKSYPMGPGDELVMFNESEAVFYFVTTDDSGFKTIDTCDFTIRNKPIDVTPVIEEFDSGCFASKEDIDAIDERLGNIEKMLEGLV